MDLTWSAADTTAELLVAPDEDTGVVPLPPEPPPPPVDSLSEPPPEYGPEPDNSPKFSVVATV